MITDTDLITAQIVAAAYRLHKALGPGLVEAVYERIMARDLRRGGSQVERQRTVSFVYDGMFFAKGFRVDLLVNGCVVVEVKARAQTLPIHRRQLYTYLRLLGLQVGLVLNFGAPTMKEGIHRVVNGYQPGPNSLLRVNRPSDLD